MRKNATLRNFFSHPQDWSEKEITTANNSSFTAVIAIITINFEIISLGHNLFFGNKQDKFMSAWSSYSCLVPVVIVVLISIFGILQLLAWLIPGVMLYSSRRPFFRGIGLGILLGASLTFIGYYLWIAIRIIQHA